MATGLLGEESTARLIKLIKTEFEKYVKCEDGKGLSTEDFTTELLNKLNELDPDAQIDDTLLSAVNFVFMPTDNKKITIRRKTALGVQMDIEAGCWLSFCSQSTGVVYTTKEQLEAQLGNAYSSTETTITISVDYSNTLVFDVTTQTYKIVANDKLKHTYAIILGVTRNNVVGAAVTIANSRQYEPLFSAANFVFIPTDNKKMSIRPNTNTGDGVYLDVEIGCWLDFYSQYTGRVYTKKEQLLTQLASKDGGTFEILTTSLTFYIKSGYSLVFDVLTKTYDIVSNNELKHNYAIILGVYKNRVTGAAVIVANHDQLTNATQGSHTTLAGYGITDAYTKEETAEVIDDAIDAALENFDPGSGSTPQSSTASLSAANFIFMLTDNKKLAIRPDGTGSGVYLDIEAGCWLMFCSQYTGLVYTKPHTTDPTQDQLKTQLGSAYSTTQTTRSIRIELSNSLVFDVTTKTYKIVSNTALNHNYAIILGVNRNNVTGAAVTIANRDRLRKLDDTLVTLTDDEILACKNYSALFASTDGRTESLLFFTDLHMVTADGFATNFDITLDRIKAVYDNTSILTCVCGGDWLTNGNTKADAAWILGKIEGAMKSRFKNYINMVGNHDTNYQGQGYLNGNEENTLSDTAIRNLWFSRYGHSYFSVNGECTRFYVFDTGIDSYEQMNTYRWEQVDWFASSLSTDKAERSAAMLHIGTKNYVATPMVDNITKIAEAFNSRATITLNDKTYDFTNAEGHFYFMLAGHAHVDMDLVQNTIPVILTTNVWADQNVPSYDLVLADYGSNQLKLIRVGTGDDRTFTMA